MTYQRACTPQKTACASLFPFYALPEHQIHAMPCQIHPSACMHSGQAGGDSPVPLGPVLEAPLARSPCRPFPLLTEAGNGGRDGGGGSSLTCYHHDKLLQWRAKALQRRGRSPTQAGAAGPSGAGVWQPQREPQQVAPGRPARLASWATLAVATAFAAAMAAALATAVVRRLTDGR